MGKLRRLRVQLAAATVLGSVIGVGSTAFAPAPAGATDCLPSATSPGSYLACVVNDQVDQAEQTVLGVVPTAQQTVGTVVYYVETIERCWTGGGC